jgi:hypothetical protein
MPTLLGLGVAGPDTKGLDIHPVRSGHPQRAFNDGI